MANDTRIIDAIVPCYNEKKRVGAVLDILSNSKLINKIIVVDDGSTDGSYEVAKQFPKVTLIRLRKNSGKGNAVRVGAKAVTKPLVFLCDADIKGFSANHIEQMLNLIRKNPSTMIVGLREKRYKTFAFHLMTSILPLIAGERLLHTEDLLKIVQYKNIEQYGIEPYMNYYFHKSRKKITKTFLQGVNDVSKFNKAERTVWDFIYEVINIAGTYVRIYTYEMPKDFAINAKLLLQSFKF